jgi:hypothetical protein
MHDIQESMKSNFFYASGCLENGKKWLILPTDKQNQKMD